MSNWSELIQVAVASALALFGALFFIFVDFSSTSAAIDGTERLLTAIILSFKPTGISFLIDAVAALLTGVVSFKTVGGNVVAWIFVAVFVYSFISISVNYFVVAPGMI